MNNPNPNRPDMFADPDGHDEWLIRETISRMSRDSDRQQTVKERSGLALADTEREIFGETFGQDTYQEGVDLDYLSQTEGWDGNPVSEAENMARNVYGDEVDGILTDRPLESAEEYSALDRVQELEQQLARNNQQLQNLNAHYNPQYQQQRADARNQMLEQHGLIATDDAAADRFANQLQTAQQELSFHRDQRVRESIESQRAEYGNEAVDDAIGRFMQLQNSHVGRTINDMTYASPNPGRTFLAMMHDSDVVDSMLGDQHPHMRTGRAPSRPSRAPRMASEQEEYSSGYGDSTVEDNIFNSAFDR